MGHHGLYNSLIIFLLPLVLVSCASSKAPARWLPEPEATPRDPYGSWIEIVSRNGNSEGELIALSGDTMYIANRNFCSIAATDILSARLFAYDASDLAAPFLFGTFSLVTGVYTFAYTGPIWILLGSVALRGRSLEPVIDFPENSLKQFVPFARFPQGLPPDMNRTIIKIKP